MRMDAFVQSVLSVLAALSQQVTNHVIRVNGKVDLQCEKATNRIIREASKIGLTLEHCRGFYLDRPHHWAQLGDIIIDPTASQFGAVNGVSGVKGSFSHVAYNRVPEEILEGSYMRGCPSSQMYWRWLEMKENIEQGCGYHVLNDVRVEEVRTSKRGHEYVFIKPEAHWEDGDCKAIIRSLTIFINENSHNVLVWWAKRTKEGKMVTWNQRVIIAKDGTPYVSKKGKLSMDYKYSFSYECMIAADMLGKRGWQRQEPVQYTDYTGNDGSELF